MFHAVNDSLLCVDTLPSNCLGVLGSLHCDNATNETCYTASYAVQRDNSVVFLISARTPASTWVGLGVSDDQRMVSPALCSAFPYIITNSLSIFEDCMLVHVYRMQKLKYEDHTKGMIRVAGWYKLYI